jgi:hypothetical protein
MPYSWPVRAARIALALALMGLIAASPARADVTIGSTLTATPSAETCGGCTFAQTSGVTTASERGVITRWRIKAGAAGASARLQVIHRDSGAASEVTSSPVVSPPVGTTVYPTRLPIALGDGIALATTEGSFFAGGGTADVFIPALTATPAVATESRAIEVLVNADIEPDADGDGFGDETQDECPTDASTQGDCAPPNTTISKGPNDKTRKKTATFEFTSNEPGSSFQCSLDGQSAFRPCTSPLTVKVKKGRHSFQVQATDQAGNADRSPATDDWKVKRKRKR